MKKFLAILVAFFLVTKVLDALKEHLKPEEPPAVQVAQVIDEKLFWLSKSEQKYLPLLMPDNPHDNICKLCHNLRCIAHMTAKETVCHIIYSG
jgi:hypothetical protein